MQIQPAYQHYKSVQLDEVGSFVGKRKTGKYWLLYAYSPATDEILAYSCGSRSAKTIKDLLKKLKKVGIEPYCTDHWRAFAQVLPPKNHLIGKAYTKNIEGINTCIRTKNKRWVRKTTCFSKNKYNHLAASNFMFNYRHKLKTKHHTF